MLLAAVQYIYRALPTIMQRARYSHLNKNIHFLLIKAMCVVISSPFLSYSQILVNMMTVIAPAHSSISLSYEILSILSGAIGGPGNTP